MAQPPLPPQVDFISQQRMAARANQAFINKQDGLQTQLKYRGISNPSHIYLRSFKMDSTLEVWLKGESATSYTFFKTYRVCASAGKIGPKRKEGDKQVPEGFYYIDHFNPNSNYHLSLGINYPNVSDLILADAVRPGSAIYIHGSCVSIGCLAINDDQIEELYVLSTLVRNNGQEYIPVHIFPGRFNTKYVQDSVQKTLAVNKDYTNIIHAMKQVYYNFEKNRSLLPVLINNKGTYIVDEIKVPNELLEYKAMNVPRWGFYKVRTYQYNEIIPIVDKMPQYKLGVPAFANSISKISDSAKQFLTPRLPSTTVITEFVVNTDGEVSNVQIVSGGNDMINDKLIRELELLNYWEPAIKNNKPVACKMRQVFYIK
jgi:murein L,D-transpeptidase YafK